MAKRPMTDEERAAVDAWWADQPEDRFDYVDNTRFAIVGNADEEAAYAEAELRGCCGYCDVILDLPSGAKLMFGFNYGH